MVRRPIATIIYLGLFKLETWLGLLKGPDWIINNQHGSHLRPLYNRRRQISTFDICLQKHL